MKTLRLALAAAALSVALGACSGGSPTAPASRPTRRAADAAPNDTTPKTSSTPPSSLPTDPPPPPDPRQIIGSGA